MAIILFEDINNREAARNISSPAPPKIEKNSSLPARFSAAFKRKLSLGENSAASNDPEAEADERESSGMRSLQDEVLLAYQ